MKYDFLNFPHVVNHWIVIYIKRNLSFLILAGWNCYVCTSKSRKASPSAIKLVKAFFRLWWNKILNSVVRFDQYSYSIWQRNWRRAGDSPSTVIKSCRFWFQAYSQMWQWNCSSWIDFKYNLGRRLLHYRRVTSRGSPQWGWPGFLMPSGTLNYHHLIQWKSQCTTCREGMFGRKLAGEVFFS